VDVHHDEIAGDPIALAERIYARLARPLDRSAHEAISSYARAHRKGEHGVHTYRLEDYGLTPAVVERRFASYCERFAAALR
jgi:hypothetical protein